MKKFFVDAEVELTLLSALDDILTASVGGDAGDIPDEEYEEDGI